MRVPTRWKRGNIERDVPEPEHKYERMKPWQVSVPIACWTLLAIVWVTDLFSPQLLVVAILLSAPVALSVATSNASLTWQLMAGGLVADFSAGWFNAFQAHFHLEPIALGDRFLAALAIVVVGSVTIRAVRQSHTAAELAQRNARSELMRDLIYALAHDLRTPLTAARITLRQALAGAYGELPLQYRDILQRSIASNEDVTRLAETLLSVARYEAGDQSHRREPVNIVELCTSVATEMQSLFDVRAVALQCNVPSLDAFVLGDAADLRRALINLIANAANWTPKGGTVSVNLTVIGRYAGIRIEDNGYGVPEDLREHMFERFVGRSRHVGGTGLGLYIVRRILEAHSGSVRYEPRTPIGSTFTISLPLCEQQKAS
jgi:signal transduction histidine kinase